jgi:hypothetical protein
MTALTGLAGAASIRHGICETPYFAATGFEGVPVRPAAQSAPPLKLWSVSDLGRRAVGCHVLDVAFAGLYRQWE